jgi:hypothetical protein
MPVITKYLREGNNVNQETKSFPEIHIDLENRVESSFDQTIIEVVDLTFSKLGVKVKQTLYSSLAVDYKLSKENIPSRIEEFVGALEKIFGTSALLLEIDVMKTIRQKVPAFKCETKNPNLAFGDYLKSLKSYM